MSAVAGKSGSVTLGSYTVNFREWMINHSADINDATGFSSAGAAENVGGVTRWGGSASGYVNSTATPAITDGTASTGTFTTTGTLGYSGSLIIGNVRVGTGVDGNATVALDFTGTGVLTKT